MKGIYLAAYKDRHYDFDIDYNDIIDLPGINVLGDLLDVDLTVYDFILASPPCNYYSKANYRRDFSDYALKTKHLLPDILHKLVNIGKPFIVENVRNEAAFKFLGLFDLPGINVYFIGRHTYWTNIDFNFVNVPYSFDFGKRGLRLKSNCQGGSNVHIVFDKWLNLVVNNKADMYQMSIFDFI